jgi:hypothetical protein
MKHQREQEKIKDMRPKDPTQENDNREYFNRREDVVSREEDIGVS